MPRKKSPPIYLARRTDKNGSLQPLTPWKSQKRNIKPPPRASRTISQVAIIPGIPVPKKGPQHPSVSDPCSDPGWYNLVGIPKCPLPEQLGVLPLEFHQMDTATKGKENEDFQTNKMGGAGAEH